MSCTICHDPQAEWVHVLDWEKSHFTLYGKGHVWANTQRFCDRCEALYRSGDDETLVLLQARTQGVRDEAVDEEIRKPLAVLRAAHQRTVPFNDLLPPGAGKWRSAGYTPIDELTGTVEIARVWPEHARRSAPETREDFLAYRVDGKFWLVRSPWPALGVDDVMQLLWLWVEEQASTSAGVLPDDEARLDVVRQFFALDEQVVLTLRRPTDEN